MKKYLLLIYSFPVIAYCQELYGLKGNPYDGIINSELAMMNKNNNHVIVLEDTEKNMLIISKEYYLRFIETDHKVLKRKKKRMNKKESSFFEKCIQNVAKNQFLMGNECITGIEGRSKKCFKIKSSYYKNNSFQFSNTFTGSLIFTSEYYNENYTLDLYNLLLYKTPTIKVNIKNP